MNPFRGKSSASLEVMVIAFCLLLFLFALLIRTYSANQQLLTTTQNTHLTLTAYLSSVVEAETANRGFVLTKEEQFLLSYESAVQTVRQSFLELQNTPSFDSLQQAQLTQIQLLVEQKLAHMKKNIKVRQQNGLYAAAQRTSSGQGEILMDAIRREVGVVQLESDKMIHYYTEMEDRIKSILYLMLVLIIIQAVVIFDITSHRIEILTYNRVPK